MYTVKVKGEHSEFVLEFSKKGIVLEVRDQLRKQGFDANVQLVKEITE